MIRQASVFSLAVIWLATAAVAHAQDSAAADARGARVSGVFGGASARSATDFTFAGTVGYRFDRFFGVEFDITTIPDLQPEPVFAILARAVPSFFPIEMSARGIFFTANVRTEIPSGRRWLIPYATGGGGVASVTDRMHIPILAANTERFDWTSVIPGGVIGGIIGGLPRGAGETAIFPPISRDFSTTATHLTLNVGGGVSFVILKGLSIDADLRLYRIFANEEFNAVRFGTGASYRF